MIKRSQLRKAPGWIATAAGLLAFLLMLLSVGSVDTYLARRGLALESGVMLRGFRDAMDEARTDLVSLPSLDKLECENGISVVLGRHIFDNEYVRWLAVVRNGEIICRGTYAGISIPQEYRVLLLDNEWSFMMVRSPSGAESLMLVQKRGDLQYHAVFEHLLFDFLSIAPCHTCVSYTLVLGEHSEIEMPAGTMSAPAQVSYTANQVQRYGRLKLTLFATQEYVDSFRLYGWIWTAGLATLIAAIIGLTVYAFLIRRISLAFLIKQGLKRGEFIAYYQPIVDSRDGTVLGAEMLARWRTHDGKFVPPGQFIPMAEDSGLIEPITDHLMEQVLVDMERLGWLDSDRFVSINAVAHQITDSPFCDNLLGMIAQGKLSAKNLAVEITERHQFTDLEKGKHALLRLADAGIRIKLDDAGTGFGGFVYVQELPIHTLKIDKMFVDTLKTTGDAKRAVLEAIIEFARTSGLDIIAEGVETQEQVEQLRKRNVYANQGYVYARPMPADEFIHWVAAQKTGASSSQQSA